jgi:hypothetical protein
MTTWFWFEQAIVKYGRCFYTALFYFYKYYFKFSEDGYNLGDLNFFFI